MSLTAKEKSMRLPKRSRDILNRAFRVMRRRPETFERFRCLLLTQRCVERLARVRPRPPPQRVVTGNLLWLSRHARYVPAAAAGK